MPSRRQVLTGGVGVAGLGAPCGGGREAATASSGWQSWRRGGHAPAALLLPAVGTGDRVFDGLDALADLPIGVWCGTEDPLHDPVRALVDALPTPPETLTYAEGSSHQDLLGRPHDRRVALARRAAVSQSPPRLTTGPPSDPQARRRFRCMPLGTRSP